MSRSCTLSWGIGLIAVSVMVACSEPTALEIEEFDPVLSVEPQLARALVCAGHETASASAIIGPRGGEVRLGDHRVLVPRFAVRKPTEITMTVMPAQEFIVEFRANGREHFEFARPIKVTLSYDDCRTTVNARRLSAWHLDAETKTFLQRMPSRVNAAARTITFTTDHFSFFAIAD